MRFQVEKEEPIQIVAYDAKWPSRFEAEKRLLEQTIAGWVRGGIHHVGSTSIPGLAAKPVIDIMVGVESLEAAKPCADLLAEIEYCHYPYKPEQMHWFCKPSPYRRTHHLYLIQPSHPQWEARLSFRDYLRSHRNARDEYELLKTALAERFRDDREGYTEAKTAFIRNIVAKAFGKEVGF